MKRLRETPNLRKINTRLRNSYNLERLQRDVFSEVLFTGIMQIPSLRNLMTIENSDTKIQKNYIEHDNDAPL